VFEGHAPGDAVRCPVEGCAFCGTVRQVAAHVADVDGADHAAAARAVERAKRGESPDGRSDDDPAVEAFVRRFEEAHGERAGYESDRQGGWLFPFEDE